MNDVDSSVGAFVNELKNTILHSQYKAAKAVNTQLTQLYYVLGAAISVKIKQAQWGDKVVETIAHNLQTELSHLKGFSAANLKKMKLFYEAYPHQLKTCSLFFELSQMSNNEGAVISSPLANQTEEAMHSPLANESDHVFWNISFSNHFAIISKVTDGDERLWYINEVHRNNWSKRVLENHLKNDLYQQVQLPNNFDEQLPKQTQRQAIAQFRDEYLLDFLSIDDSDDERLIENKIVQNIKDFLMNMGSGFSFMGNQYRLNVNGDDFFVDLLFYNRHLQALVAIELKRGKFKPEHLGQIGFYLNVLDQQVRLPNENPSIGIILCKEKNNVVVEYALQGTKQPMGVATYSTGNELPDDYKKALPNAQQLIKLMNDEE